MEREPRAALILNRFTRSLTVMFATNAVTSVLGVTPEEVQDKSFWECVAENCAVDALNCLESAKANDSIAYLRFWSRDPRREEDFEDEDSEDSDDEDVDERSVDGRELGDAVRLNNAMDIDSDEVERPRMPRSGLRSTGGPALNHLDSTLSPSAGTRSEPHTYQGTLPTSSPPDNLQHPRPARRPESRINRRRPIPSIELEAVVSCTSDGLVVVLRKARPPIPNLHPPLLPVHNFENGLFAAPWSDEPVNALYPAERFHTFQPPLLTQHMPLQEHVKADGGPPIQHLMRAIRDVAVFAWALVGINSNIAQYGRGTPRGNAQPHDEVPGWDSQAGKKQYLGTESQATRRLSNALVHNAHGSQNGAPAAPHVPVFTADAPQGYSRTSDRFNSMELPYTNPPAWSHSNPYTIPPQSLSPYLHAQPTHPTVQPPNLGSAHPRELWAEAPPYGQQGVHPYSIPTSQSDGASSSYSYRSLWQ